MAFNEVRPFPYVVAPLTNVVPFTYRDGMTFLEMMEGIRAWLNHELVPDLNLNLDEAMKRFQEGIDNAENRIIENEKEHQQLFADLIESVHKENADFAAMIRALVDTINNKTGPVDIQRTTLTGPHVVNINPLWPNNQHVYISLAQDVVGNRAVTLTNNITGPLDVNMAPGGVTDFWLIPRADKSTWYVFQPSAGTRGTVNDKTSAKLVAGDTATREAVDARISPVAAAIRDETATGLAETAKTAKDRHDAHVTRSEKIYPLDPIDVVFIGDSYFMGYQSSGVDWLAKDMPTRITELLNAQGLNTYRKHNYGTAATGFARGSNDVSYSGQLAKAAANTAITNCRLVVIGGGQNDAGTDVYEAAKTVFNNARAKWPNAKIVFAPMWHPGQFKNIQRRTFMAGFRAARELGVIHDVNSLWVQSITGRGDWLIENNVWHPKANATQALANAIHTLIQGGSLPAQSIDMQMHSSAQVTEGVATLNGWNVALSFQQFVGADFKGDYLLGTIGYEVMTPGGINQYLNGYAASGNELKLFTIEAVTGKIFLTGGGTAGGGICGLAGSYPVGM